MAVLGKSKQELDVYQVINGMLRNGFTHYSRLEERNVFTAFLIDPDISHLSDQIIKQEEEGLPAGMLRTMKTNAIIAIAVFSRIAMDLGANDLHCYAIGDYLNVKTDAASSVQQVRDIMEEAIKAFSKLLSDSKRNEHSYRVNQTIRYIHGHLYEKVSVKEIAAALNINASYLSDLFHREMGERLHDYIQRLKLEEARTLLMNTTYSVTEIAEMLGFSSVSYFGKVFRKEFLTSPSAFIRAFR